MKFNRLVMFIMLCGLAATVKAEEEVTSGEGTKVTQNNDDENYVGDRVGFAYDRIFTVNSDKYCIPAGVTVRIVEVSDDKVEFYRPAESPLSPFTWFSSSDHELKMDACDKATKVLPKQQIKSISSNEFNLSRASRFGWSYGALIAPYKYYSRTEEFKGSTAIAPYLGYRADFVALGFEVKPVMFAGISPVEVVNDDKTTSSVFAYSWGGGFLFEIKDEFQVGFLIGTDITSDSDNFVNNKKPWYSIAIGYDFSN